jgi:WhiB family transcriptional regulator, redox-sensing transcriptional regulator
MSSDGRNLMIRLGPWMDHAACRGMVASADEDIFFAPERDELGGNRGTATRVAATREREALAVCDRCPVQVECLAYAVTTRQQHGVWGGKTQDELRRLVANTDRPKRCPPVDVGLRRGPRPGSRGSCPAGHKYEEANTYRYGSRQVQNLPAGPGPRPAASGPNPLSPRTCLRPGQHCL